jgi:hypothetical protein
MASKMAWYIHTWGQHAIFTSSLTSTSQNTTHKSISIVFSANSIRHDSAITVNRSSHPPVNTKNGARPGAEWRIELTLKTMEMDLCVVFCVRVLDRVFLRFPKVSHWSLVPSRLKFGNAANGGGGGKPDVHGSRYPGCQRFQVFKGLETILLARKLSEGSGTQG